MDKKYYTEVFHDGLPNTPDINTLQDREIKVIWSGGYDSTCLLHALAKWFPDKQIIAISVYCDCIANKKRDNKARTKIKQLFKKQGIKNILYRQVYIKLPALGCCNGLAQPAIWLSIIPYTTFGDYSAVCFGYIREDDIWHFIEPFKQVFYNMAKITQNNKAQLYFPLEFTSKVDVLSYLKYHGLFDACSTCEQEDFNNDKPCGVCASCKKHKAAEIMLQERIKQQIEYDNMKPLVEE